LTINRKLSILLVMVRLMLSIFLSLE